MEINEQLAKKKIEQIADGKIFTVFFIKKTDGTRRKMNCRKGVKKGVNGNGLKFNPADHNLVTVYDMQKQGHRMVNLETVYALRMEGVEYIVV